MMSALREEIRAILREEIAGLGLGAGRPVSETVQIRNGEDLTRFAQDILARAADPAFAAALAGGMHRFDLRMAPAVPSGFAAAVRPGAANSAAAIPDAVQKSLITERDIAALRPDQKVLRIGPASRLTPLAQDEARRKGIRIERCAT